jgi:hypothetical protein
VANSLPALEVVTSDEVRAIISGARLRAAA